MFFVNYCNCYNSLLPSGNWLPLLISIRLELLRNNYFIMQKYYSRFPETVTNWSSCCIRKYFVLNFAYFYAIKYFWILFFSMYVRGLNEQITLNILSLICTKYVFCWWFNIMIQKTKIKEMYIIVLKFILLNKNIYLIQTRIITKKRICINRW